MSKELEALKDLREDAKHHLDSHIEYLNERLDIIENALKENERLKRSCLENLLCEESKDYIYKKLKALEIIKERPWLAMTDFQKYTYEEWLALFDDEENWHNPFKSKEEYNLLKEVLL